MKKYCTRVIHFYFFTKKLKMNTQMLPMKMIGIKKDWLKKNLFKIPNWDKVL